ncbi:MAG: hypothetical protein PF436_11810 [Prolixibacteraceae bacterium]|jgi:hypothetical protein|nr:hypothetical protein [Prolixibacteraceae bacterium]
MKQIYKITFLLPVLIFAMGQLLAQEIGGKESPLLGSVHTYNILMGNENYTPNWGLYPENTTATEIEDGTATPLIPGTDYSVITLPVSEQIVGGRSYWKIQFNKNINENTTYVVGYKESTADANKCLTAEVRSITVYPPFDVDLALNDDENPEDCSDNTNDLKDKAALDAGLQTTTVYKVYIEYPGNPPGYIDGGGTWTFRFNVSVSGRSGDNATIATISANDGATSLGEWTPGSDSYTTPDINVAAVSSTTVTPVYVEVTYNEVLGVTQDITVEISSIFGAHSESDIDVVENTQPGNNIVEHTIYAMPDVSEIMAWN